MPGVLAALVGVDDQPRFRLALLDCHQRGLQHQIGVHTRLH